MRKAINLKFVLILAVLGLAMALVPMVADAYWNSGSWNDDCYWSNCHGNDYYNDPCHYNCGGSQNSFSYNESTHVETSFQFHHEFGQEISYSQEGYGGQFNNPCNWGCDDYYDWDHDPCDWGCDWNNNYHDPCDWGCDSGWGYNDYDDHYGCDWDCDDGYYDWDYDLCDWGCGGGYDYYDYDDYYGGGCDWGCDNYGHSSYYSGRDNPWIQNTRYGGHYGWSW